MKRALAGLGLALVTAGGCAAQAPRPPSVVVAPGRPGPHVEDPGKLPETPPTVPDVAYDARVRSSAASAEMFQGVLDGGWTLSADGKGDLYAFELVDKHDTVEGAWRDLRRTSEPAASGVLREVQRLPSGLAIGFAPAGQTPVNVTLDGHLRGQLQQGRTRMAVTLRKDATKDAK
jgi:hypothetical protein